MTVYSLMLFLHVGAALAPASALSIDALIVVQLRRAASPSPTKACLDLWRTVPGLAGGSGLVRLPVRAISRGLLWPVCRPPG
jgi:hypothetical protein